MFTLHVKIEMENLLGRAVSYLQHMTSLAVVESVRTLPGYEVIWSSLYIITVQWAGTNDQCAHACYMYSCT